MITDFSKKKQYYIHLHRNMVKKFRKLGIETKEQAISNIRCLYFVNKMTLPQIVAFVATKFETTEKAKSPNTWRWKATKELLESLTQETTDVLLTPKTYTEKTPKPTTEQMVEGWAEEAGIE